MLKAATALLSVLLFASACGGDGGSKDSGPDLTKDETKVAGNIADQLSKDEQAGLSKKDAKCFADQFVGAAGVDKLEKAKLVDKEGKVQESGAKFDKKLSGQYADAYLDCVDFAKEVATSFSQTNPQVDAKKMTSCLEEKLPKDLIKKVIVATRTPEAAQNNKDVTKANNAVAQCQKDATKAPAEKQ